MNEYTEIIVAEQSSYMLERPPYWKKKEFEQWSYGNWALEKLYDLSVEYSTCPVLIRFDEFVRLMNEYACINRVFSPAYDMALWIFDLCTEYCEETEGDLR